MTVPISIYVPVFCSLDIYPEVKLLSQLVILCLILEGTIILFSIAVVPYKFIFKKKYSEKLNLPSQGWKRLKLPRFLIFHPRNTYKLKILTAHICIVCVCMCVSMSLFLAPWPEIRPRGPPFSLSLLPSSSLTFRPFQGPSCSRTDPCAPGCSRLSLWPFLDVLSSSPLASLFGLLVPSTSLFCDELLAPGHVLDILLQISLYSQRVWDMQGFWGLPRWY